MGGGQVRTHPHSTPHIINVPHPAGVPEGWGTRHGFGQPGERFEQYADHEAAAASFAERDRWLEGLPSFFNVASLWMVRIARVLGAVIQERAACMLDFEHVRIGPGRIQRIVLGPASQARRKLDRRRTWAAVWLGAR